jgi:16S rRNA A1518/A1519 N6-dimethyltransferase RsmA/KsgA/DIM1 with predicted DNA glycosylase/AP lyase activity
MAWALLIIMFILLLFSFVLLFGAPFLPTLKKQIDEALDLLALRPGETLMELGCGDGRLLRAAADRGIKAVGYELNPLLVIYCKVRCFPKRDLIKVHWRNFWHVSLGEADGIYVFLLQPYMSKLNKKIVQDASRSIRVVSLAFAFPDRKPAKVTQGFMLYIFAANKKESKDLHKHPKS